MSITPTMQVQIIRENSSLKKRAVTDRQVLMEKLQLAYQMADAALDNEIEHNSKFHDFRFNHLLGIRAGISIALGIAQQNFEGTILTEYIAGSMK